MTLKEKFDNVEIMFENQICSLKYDELSEASNQCEKIADEFAIGFADWFFEHCYEDQVGYYEAADLLEIYKKEKGL